MATCKAKACGATIRWARLPNGKGVPLDPDPRPDGNLVRSSAPLVPGGEFLVRHLADDDPPDAPRFVAHFATCPAAAEFRRARRAR